MEELSKSQLIVMKGIWEQGDNKSLSEIVTYINLRFGKNWKPQTVSTFLSRLVKKGYLDLIRDEGSWIYKIQITEQMYRENQIKGYFDFWGKKRVGQTLVSLFQNQGLEEKSIDILKELLDDLDCEEL